MTQSEKTVHVFLEKRGVGIGVAGKAEHSDQETEPKPGYSGDAQIHYTGHRSSQSH